MNDYIKIRDEFHTQKQNDYEYFINTLKSFYLLTSNTQSVSFIRDNNDIYATTSDKFAKLVGYTINELLGKTNFELIEKGSSLSKIYAEQDKQVRKLRKKLHFLDIHDKSEKVNLYIYRKSPIINPSTNSVLGVYCVVEEYKPRSGIYALNKIYNRYKNNNLIDKIDRLTPREQEVLFCVSNGMIERKLISNFLSDIHQKSIGADTTIKDILSSLYGKTGCTSMSDLMNYAIKIGQNQNIPMSLLKSTKKNLISIPL